MADDATTDILVLKTQYNIAWNYFNVHQLGDTIFEYWTEWLRRHDAGLHDNEYPAPMKQDKKLHGRLSWDVQETDITKSHIILS